MADENQDNSPEESTEDTTESDESSNTDTTDSEDSSGDDATTESDDADTKDTDDTKEDDSINPDDYDPEVRSEPVKTDDDESDEDVDPEDEKTIRRVVKKHLTPMQEQIQRQNDEIEINDYLIDNPEFSKYKPVIRKYVAHQAYRNIPIKNIAAMVASKDMQKIGARKEREAARKASETRSGGQSVRKPGGGRINWLEASKADFEKKRAEVMGMRL